MRAPNKLWSSWRDDISIRSKFIGGSDVGAILGLSKYDNPTSIWMKKTGQLPSEVEPNRFMEWGTRLEAPILDWWQERNPDLTVTPTDATWSHPDIEFLAASPDGIIEDDPRGLRIVECKNVGHYASAEWVDGIACPESYMAQARHNAYVLGATGGVVIGLIGGNEPRFVEFEADPVQEAATLQKLLAFWENVQSEEPPEIDLFSDSALEQFTMTRIESPGVEAELSDAMVEAFIERAEMKRVIDSCNKAISAADAIIASGMQGADIGTIGGRSVVSWRKTRRFDPALVPDDLRQECMSTSFDSRLFKEQHPNEYEAAMSVKSVSLHYKSTKG